MRLRRLRPAATGWTSAAVVLAALLAGCSATKQDALPDWSAPRPSPTAVGSLAPGFVDPTAPPSPEATITPSPGSWDGVHPPRGYRVLLLTSGSDDQTAVLAAAVTDWAEQEGVSLRTEALGGDDLPSAIESAIKQHPDLIVSAGNDLIDALALVTPNFLDQQFLVVGAELAEPTGNVTAADWAGASFRGEGLGMSSTFDPGTFTPERAARAVRAGTAAVLTGWRGIVVWLD